MFLEIRKFPDPVLEKKAEEIKDIGSHYRELVLAMMETMERSKGVGLAAPQVGISKRLIVFNNGKEVRALFNPFIIGKSGKETAEEGCLSLPGLFLKIRRAKKVKVEAFDMNGKKIEIETEGLTAKVLQHEIDHLDGILFIKRASLSQRLKNRQIFRELNQIRKSGKWDIAPK